jgi:hypothetical protein
MGIKPMGAPHSSQMMWTGPSRDKLASKSSIAGHVAGLGAGVLAGWEVQVMLLNRVVCF